MTSNDERARQLDQRAAEAGSLAEAQSLSAEADRLRGIRDRSGVRWIGLPLLRN